MWFDLPHSSLCRAAPTLRDLTRHHGLTRHADACGQGEDQTGACTTKATSADEPDLSTAVLQARLLGLDASGHARHDSSGGNGDDREWCDVEFVGGRSDGKVEVCRVELYPLSALVVHQERGGELLIETKCTIRGRGPTRTLQLLKGTIVGSIGTQCDDESAYAGTPDAYGNEAGECGGSVHYLWNIPAAMVAAS